MVPASNRCAKLSVETIEKCIECYPAGIYLFKVKNRNTRTITAQKMKFSIKHVFSKKDQIRNFLRIWSHLLKKSLMRNFIFCAVNVWSMLKVHNKKRPERGPRVSIDDIVLMSLFWTLNKFTDCPVFPSLILNKLIHAGCAEYVQGAVF